jgi:DNA-binding response OmpR family regulator
MNLPVPMQNTAKTPLNVSTPSPRAEQKFRPEVVHKEARIAGIEKALVIDDHLPTSEFIGEVLRACEIETYNTSDSKLAEARLRREKFDVVFVDAKMPPPDGLELARRIRAAGPNKRATIVMITGEQGSHFMQHVFEAGVNFVIFKPVDRQALMRLLRVTQGAVERERRRYSRIATACKVSMDLKDMSSHGTTIDMSLTGMRVKMTRIFPVNSVVTTILELAPEKPKLSLRCRVVRQIDDNSMGVEYEPLDEQASQKLEDFLLPRVLEAARRKTLLPPGQAALSAHLHP